MNKIYNYKVNGWNIFIAKTLSSTMDEIKNPKYNQDINTLLLSFMQTRARGRKDNKWISQLGNLFLSINYKFDINSNIFLINYLSGIVICDVVKSFLEDSNKVILKWPNDILINNKKVAGILIETESEGNKFKSIYIGAGINLKKSPDNVIYNTTSLKEEGVKKISKKEFINRITSKFNYWEKYLNENNITYILKSWMQRSCPINTEISFKNNKQEVVKGFYKGINKDGAINIKVKGKTLSYFMIEALQ